MVIGGLRPLLEDAFPFEILFVLRKVGDWLSIVNFLVHCTKPVLLLQIVWRVRSIREYGSTSCVVSLDA
jgi:hypothetical protein